MSIDNLKSKIDSYSQKHLRAESELAGCSFNFNDQKIPKNFIQTSYS